MSAITFPNNPSPGTQTTINGITYTFTDGTWVAVGQSNFYTLPIASSTVLGGVKSCLLYTSPSPRDVEESRMACSA